MALVAAEISLSGLFAASIACLNGSAGCIQGTVPVMRTARSPYVLKGLSMQVDEATVRRIARLARMRVSDEEAKDLEKELSGILDWVKQLDEVDTSAIEPMTRVVDQKLHMRNDVVTDGEIAGQITANAPMAEDNFFVVPKVVE
jgi:aspartyl-tRNA(Asn)/glutamyl-tRNA(Gln) amidotransferase subunit C